MSYTVEDRVVEMRFDNSDFEKNVNTSIKSLGELEKSLEFKNATKGLEKVKESVNGLDFTPVQTAIETISNKFSVLEVMAITAISNITNKLINMGETWLKALTVQPISTGWAEYGQQLESLQVIMANTGASLTETTESLNELNRYADLTSYSFSDMTTAISKFSAAGVGLDDSVAAIKGLSNAAALVGASKSQLYSAYYNLAQSMQQGYMQLIDWKSIANSSIGNKAFRENLIKMAIEMGKFEENSVEANKALSDFNGSLSDRWLTKDVMVKTLEAYSRKVKDYSTTVDAATGKTKYFLKTGEEVSEYWVNLGESATKSATEIKNLAGMWDVLCEAAQTGWADTWSYIVGDLNESKTLFTGVGSKISAIIEGFSEARKEFIREWVTLGGRKDVVETIYQLIKNVWSYMRPILEAINEVFPITSKGLADVTKKLRTFTESLFLTDEKAAALKQTLITILTPVRYLLNVVKTLFIFSKLVFVILKSIVQVIVSLVKNFREIPIILKRIIGDTNWQKIINDINIILNVLKLTILGIFYVIQQAVTRIIPQLLDSASPLGDLFRSLVNLGSSLLNLLSSIDWSFILTGLTNIVKVLTFLVNGVATAIDALASFFDTISKGIGKKSSNVKTTAVSAGNNILDGFIKGITNNTQIQTMTKATTGIAYTMIDAFKTALGIASPSKVFIVLGGFVIAGLIGGIVANYGTIVSTMTMVGEKVSEGFLTAIDKISNSKIFMGICSAFEKIGNIALEFLSQIKPVHVVALLIAGAIFVLANAVENLTGMFDGLNEVLEAMASKLKAQAFDTVANGIIKIAASIAILMGLAMLDPERFKDAAITIGVLSAALLVLYFVLSRVDAILNTVSGTIKNAGRVLSSSSFLLAFGTSILMLTASLKILAEMDQQEIWGSVKALIAVMSAMSALTIAISAMAPRLSRGAAFLLIFALATRVMSKSLEEIKGTIGTIEDFQYYCAQLVATMAIIYISATTVTTVINTLVTSICKNLSSMFMSLAIAAAAVGVSIILYAAAMRILAGEINDFNDTAKECLISMVGFIAVFGVLMTAVAVIASREEDGNVSRAIMSLAGAFAIMTGSLTILTAVLGGMVKLVGDIDKINAILDRLTATFSVFAVAMVAIVAIMSSKSFNKEKIEAFSSMLKSFAVTIAVIVGTLALIAIEFTVLNHIQDGMKSVGLACGVMVAAIAAIILVMSAAAAAADSGAEGLNALTSLMKQINILVGVISGIVLVFSIIGSINPDFMKKAGTSVLLITGIFINIAGLLAVIALVNKYPGSAASMWSLATMLTSIAAAFGVFALAANYIAQNNVDLSKVLLTIFAMSSIIGGLLVLVTGMANWASKSAGAIAGIYAAATAFTALSIGIGVFAIALGQAVKTMQNVENLGQSLLILAGAILYITAIIALLAALCTALGKSAQYGLIGAAIIAAMAAAMVALAFSVKMLAENNVLGNLADGLNELTTKFTADAKAVWSLFGSLLLLWIVLALIAPPILVIGVATAVAALGISAAVGATNLLIQSLGKASENIVKINDSLIELIKNIAKFKSDILSVGDMVIQSLIRGLATAAASLADAINAVGNSALKVAGAMWIALIPFAVMTILSPLLVPVILAIGIALSTVAISIGTVVLGLGLLVKFGGNLIALGDQLVGLTDKVIECMIKLYDKGEMIHRLNILALEFGKSLALIGIGFIALGAGFILTAAGILALVGATIVAFKVWGDTINSVVASVKATLDRLFNDAEFVVAATNFAKNLNKILTYIGQGLAAFGWGLVLVGAGITLSGIGLITIAVGLAALSGAFYLFQKAVPKPSKLADSLSEVSHGLDDLAIGTTCAALIAPFMPAVALGILSLAGAFALWDKTVTCVWRDLYESLSHAGGGIAQLAAGCLAGGIGTLFMMSTAMGLYVLSYALNCWNNFVTKNYANIYESLHTIAGGIAQLAAGCLAGGVSTLFMISTATGLFVLSYALDYWNNLVTRNYSRIYESLSKIGEGIAKLALCSLAGGVSTLFMMSTAMGLFVLSYALGKWNSLVATNYQMIYDSMTEIGESFETLAKSCLSLGAAAPLMIIGAAGLYALVLPLGYWIQISTFLSDLAIGMTEIGEAFIPLALGGAAIGGAAALIILGAGGLTTLGLALSKWVDVVTFLPQLNACLIPLSDGLIALGNAGSNAASILALSVALGAFTLVLLLGSYAFGVAAGNFSSGISVLSEAAPAIESTIEGVSNAASKVTSVVSTVGEKVSEATTNIGEIFTNGFANGILENSFVSSVVDAAANLGQMACEALAGPKGIDDPNEESATTHEIGNIFDNGFRNGIVELTGKAQEACFNLGRTCCESLQESVEGTNFGKTVKNVVGNVKDAGSSFVDKFKNVWSKVVSGEIDFKTLLGLDFDGISETVNGLVKNLTTAFDVDLGDTFENLGSSAEATKGTIESLTDTIRDQMSMFEKFDDATDMSAQELLNNMESQLNGITNWANGIETLGLRGMSAELIQYLAEMGPQGYKYVEAFLDMTEEEFAKANDYYAQSLTLPDEAANTVKKGYEAAGVEIIESVAAGVASGSPKAKDAIKETCLEVLDENHAQVGDAVIKYTDETFTNALNCAEANSKNLSTEEKKALSTVKDIIAEGMTPSADQLGAAWAAILKAAPDAAIKFLNGIRDDEAINKLTYQWAIAFDESYLTRINDAALYTVQGLMGTFTGAELKNVIKDAGKEVAYALIDGYEEAQDINSPSKVMAQEAKYSLLGVAKGITDNLGIVRNAGIEASDTLTKTIGAISDIFGTDFEDINPTITPVLDLSSVESGVGILNNLLNGNSSPVRNLDIQTSTKSSNDLLTESLSRIDALNAQRNRELIDAINNSDKPINLNVSLEGDAEGVFRLVEQQNLIATKSTGVSPLMTMYSNGISARRHATN